MQVLWSRAVSKQSSCRCVGCLSTTANGVTSRAANSSKRRLRIGNSVTALYGSIFAAAAIADASVKDRRRHDWDEKIAAVKAEVSELVDEEERILASLQSRRETRGINRPRQERGFGTVGRLPLGIQSPASFNRIRAFHTQRTRLNVVGARTVENQPAEENEHKIDEEDESEIFLPQETLPSWVLEDDLRLKAIQKLALRQFAIRILLRPAIAHRYSGVSMNYAADFETPQVNVSQLLEELNHIRYRMNTLKTNRNATYSDITQDYAASQWGEMQRERETLDAELTNDIHIYTSQQMSLQELLMRISNNILSSRDPDRPTAFRLMIMAFGQTRQNDLVELLLRTLLPNRFFLNPSLVITIITFFRKSKNLKDFDLFLKMLGGEGYSVNLGSRGVYKHRTVNGIDLIVPSLNSSNPVIYAALIGAALRFDQPDRADAWLQAARGGGFFDSWETLFTYLRFYSLRRDWDKGANVLKRAVTYLLSSTDHRLDSVERLLGRMVGLCDSCDRLDASDALVRAAVHSGFDPRLLLRQSDSGPFVHADTKRWSNAAKQTPKENIDRPLWQKCYDFGNTFGEYLSQIEVPPEETFARRNAKLADQHANNALFTALGRGRTPAIGEGKIPAGNTVNEDISTLKGEVAQLRELIYELRKHHISDSSMGNSSRTSTTEEPLPPPAEHIIPLKNPQPQNPPVSRNFTRTSTRISLARSQTSSSSPRKSAKRNRRREPNANEPSVESTAPIVEPALFAS
ncbi:hypothetical protein Pdw03_8104 [Penicillium digitatum]|uniref:Uncharacterized protein n=3 Tax=Penicillium digitatum TaxID=36651 RepID=K9G3I0_PEND2|nr:hypothetical protein PDIP_60160 [Penicillium digitatum Pd1]EKV10432.1 hypothetical protein PDIP_60160 [Penicillium digitatum Pd1]EKV15447.1 hypothetical protein PDIG_25680 [Penicillium digitatum PHI26]KAG0157470.1 hypothetical protein PDIDSM_4655 [Penicillium digitatum]QQK44203.1 hypothetical protein Pdw03_8104 [Penicillium digitatum]